MKSLKNIDLLLGESLELLMKASSEIRNVSHDNFENQLRHIGKATVELWEIRDTIYKIKPELKRDFVKESEEDHERYEILDKIYQKAISLEKNGKNKEANALFSELLKRSHYGWFKLLAEAGLYRLHHMQVVNKHKSYYYPYCNTACIIPAQ